MKNKKMISDAKILARFEKKNKEIDEMRDEREEWVNLEVEQKAKTLRI